MKLFEKRASKKEKIEEIKKMAENELPALIKACQDAPDNTETRKIFETRNTAMKMLIIETVIGAYTEQKGDTGEWKYVFKQQLPDLADLNTICDIVEVYYETYEKPYIQQPAVDDIGMPKGNANVPFHVDRVNKKELAKGVNDYINRYQIIDRAVIMKLAQYGQEIRKKQNLYTALIIGGIMITIAGAAVTGVYLYNKKKSSDDGVEEIPEVDIDDINVEVGDVDVPVIEEQDVPVVVID